MSEESKKGIYDQSSFDAIKCRLNGTKPKYPATPLENGNNAPGRRDAQFENHCPKQINKFFLLFFSFRCIQQKMYKVESFALYGPPRIHYFLSSLSL